MGNRIISDLEPDESQKRKPERKPAGSSLRSSSTSLLRNFCYRTWEYVYSPSGSRRVRPDDPVAEFFRDKSAIDPTSAGVFIRQVERLDVINKSLPASCFPAFSDFIVLKIDCIDEEFTYTEMKVMEDDDQALRELERFVEIKEGQRSVDVHGFRAIDEHIDKILRKKVVLLLRENGLDMDESGNLIVCAI